MTSKEKSDIYSLLSKAGSSVLGYGMDGFDEDILFEDDMEISGVAAPEKVCPQESIGQDSNKKVATLDSVAKKISQCKNCGLFVTRINAVPGEGVENPLVMVIGEGPGEDEDKTGRPFVGKAGQLLDKMLGAIGLDRNRNCFIANIVKCRPPMNRTPTFPEADACSGYLMAQIHILKPKAILALGRTAVQNLLKTDDGINSIRGRLLDYNGIPFLATYHPSALLRNETLKRPAWEDLKKFREKLLEISPGYQGAD